MKRNTAYINFSEKPVLKRPVFIAGFEGWPNAGNISTDTLNFLKTTLPVRKFAEIAPDPFYRYSDVRPQITVEEGEVIRFSFSPYELFCYEGDGEHDLILFSGSEPEMAWKQFTQAFLDLAVDLAVEMILTVGGTYDYITHNQEPLVSGVFNQESLRRIFQDSGIKPAEYQGPTSIHTMVLTEARQRDIKCINLWGHAPQYLQSNNLPVIHQVLVHLRQLGGFELDLTDLKFKALELQKQINFLVQKSPELSRIIEKIEKGPQNQQRNTSSAEVCHDKVIDISEFLRKDHFHD